MTFAELYIRESATILQSLNYGNLEKVVSEIADVRNRKGRLFVIGVGGSAATASHAVNDLRKICGIEAYAPTDNVAELTARTNDDGWDTTFIEWLRTSHLVPRDGVLILSVGGGTLSVSVNLVKAVRYANEQGATVLGIVGRDGGYTAQYADSFIWVPPQVKDRITPHTEGLTSVLLHLIVSHPTLCSR